MKTEEATEIPENPKERERRRLGRKKGRGINRPLDFAILKTCVRQSVGLRWVAWINSAL